eukprot:360050-Chlamydomonas_euryale.AAC.2
MADHATKLGGSINATTCAATTPAAVVDSCSHIGVSKYLRARPSATPAAPAKARYATPGRRIRRGHRDRRGRGRHDAQQTDRERNSNGASPHALLYRSGTGSNRARAPPPTHTHTCIMPRP